MAKNVLAGLALGAGRKAAGMVSNQANGANHAHAVAIDSHYRGLAQQRAHEHFIAASSHLHKLTGGKGGVNLDVDSAGRHTANWTGKKGPWEEGGAEKPAEPAKNSGEVAKTEEAPAKAETKPRAPRKPKAEAAPAGEPSQTAEDLHRDIVKPAKPAKPVNPSADIPSEAPANKGRKPKAVPAPQPPTNPQGTK